MLSTMKKFFLFAKSNVVKVFTVVRESFSSTINPESLFIEIQ